METKRTEKVILSFVFGVIEKIIILLLPFLVRTILIKKLGIEYAGISGLFTSILTFLNVADLGFSSATMFCLYRPVAEDDEEEICSLAKFLKIVYLAVSGVIALVGIAFTPFLKYFINGTLPEGINIYVVFLIYVFNSSSSYCFAAYRVPILEAHQENYVVSMIRTIAEIVKSIGQIVILLISPNYYIFALFLPLSTLLINFLLTMYFRKKMSWCVPKGNVSKETKKVLRNKMFFLMLHKIASAITNSVDNIVISSFIGLALVGIYGNYSLVTSALMGVVLVFYNSLKPAVANQIIKSKENSIDVYKSLLFVSLLMCSFISVCLCSLFQPFIFIWLGETYLLSSTAVLLIVMFFFFNATRQFFSSIYIDIFGLWDKTIVVQLISALLNLVLDIALGKFYGIEGIVFASFASTGFVSLPFDIWLVSKMLCKKKKDLILHSIFEYFLFLAVCFISIGVIQRLLSFNVFKSLTGFTIDCLVTAFSSFVLLCMPICLYKKEASHVFMHLRRFLKRGRNK